MNSAVDYFASQVTRLEVETRTEKPFTGGRKEPFGESTVVARLATARVLRGAAEKLAPAATRPTCG